MTILAANTWPTNGHLIRDCAELGYLRKEWITLDPTYGRGVWWKIWKPDMLYQHDIALDGTDFRHLPYWNKFFDAVAFDPPYVSVGGRETTTMPEFADRFGMHTTPTTPIALQELIYQGLDECYRVLKPRGFLLVKCQDYISSGKYWAGTTFTSNYCMSLSLELVDRLERIQMSPRPQPPNRSQIHARRNLSTLFVFRRH